MLFYNLITDAEGRDNSEGCEVYFDKEKLSKQCITCRFYYFMSKNFNNKNNICDGCFHCVVYENENYPLIFRVLTLKNGTFRTVSSYFLSEMETILEKMDFKDDTKKFGWIYKKSNTDNNNNNNNNNQENTQDLHVESNHSLS